MTLDQLLWLNFFDGIVSGCIALVLLIGCVDLIIEYTIDNYSKQHASLLPQKQKNKQPAQPQKPLKALTTREFLTLLAMLPLSLWLLSHSYTVLRDALRLNVTPSLIMNVKIHKIGRRRHRPSYFTLDRD